MLWCWYCISSQLYGLSIHLVIVIYVSLFISEKIGNQTFKACFTVPSICLGEEQVSNAKIVRSKVSPASPLAIVENN
jgi:hypothetical protein